MIKELLKAAGVVAWPVRCPDPPTGTYALYFDDVTADGPDGLNSIFTHDAMVELYEPKQDPDTEARLEAELDKRGLHYTKQSRYWLSSVQRYQVIYEFSYIEKRRA